MHVLELYNMAIDLELQASANRGDTTERPSYTEFSLHPRLARTADLNDLSRQFCKGVTVSVSVGIDVRAW